MRSCEPQHPSCSIDDGLKSLEQFLSDFCFGEYFRLSYFPLSIFSELSLGGKTERKKERPEAGGSGPVTRIMDHWTISLMMACTLAAFAATSAVYSQQQPVLMSEVDIAAVDIAGHHFDIDSPSDEMTACYYCINVSSNEMCNRFAIETPCSTADDYSSDMTVCYTFHVMDERGKTVTVTKQCATTETCSSQVGCRLDKATNQTVCVSCCDLNYCNVEVAFNASDAVFQRSNDETAAFSSATRSADGARWALIHQSLIFCLLAFLSSSI